MFSRGCVRAKTRYVSAPEGRPRKGSALVASVRLVLATSLARSARSARSSFVLSVRRASAVASTVPMTSRSDLLPLDDSRDRQLTLTSCIVLRNLRGAERATLLPERATRGAQIDLRGYRRMYDRRAGRASGVSITLP